jgi:hypothetical protein
MEPHNPIVKSFLNTSSKSGGITCKNILQTVVINRKLDAYNNGME